VALPQMLEKIEAEMTTARPAEKLRFKRQAQLIRGLLAPSWRDTADGKPSEGVAKIETELQQSQRSPILRKQKRSTR
jgi:hypothetical protein